jgi:hypothetical protein
MTNWLRKPSVSRRYDHSTRWVDRAWKEGRLPKPGYPFGNGIPAWSEEELDAHDRAVIAASVAAGGKVKKPPSAEAVEKARLAKKKQAGGEVNASQ